MKSLALAVLLLVGPAALYAAPPLRAVWMWEAESYALLESPRAAKKAIKFLKSKGVGTLYLYADAYKGRSLIENKPKLYRNLLRRLNKEGLNAYALLGSWHLRTHEYVLPERRAEARAMFQRVLDYNAAARPGERFDGVNLDIEPHMLDAWETDREGLLLNFLDLGRDLMALKARSGLALEVGPAIPFWLDGIELEWEGRRKPASEHVLDIYDYAALMAYRDRAAGRDGIIALSASELAYAGSLGKRLAVGVEVTPNEVKKISFSRLAEADLERELALAGEAFAREPAFSGFVLHHYESYRAWLDAQGGKKRKGK
ncbi:MAG: hypothetical protein CVU79_07385 [Elusimicrobia bacterium HGW-Elusimicrobia-3]|nr:MAG: hypothetical protein CVU79_07385 [Elusimicrobia bacterium HGW-Elusimicrobia-3]